MSLVTNVIDSIISPPTTNQPIPKEIMEAAVILGYSGHSNSWETFEPYQQARPDLDKQNKVIPVTLSCVKFGHIYDIEQGGGQNRNIGIFMHNAKNVWKTQTRWGLQWLYTFASNVEAMVTAALSFGYIQGRDYYVLAAHPNSRFGEHICAPHVCNFPRADGTQDLFAKIYDRSILNSYMLHSPPKPPPNLTLKIFPTDVGDPSYPNNGNERLTVEQVIGALKQPVKYKSYLKGTLYKETKAYRDRCMYWAKLAPRPRGWSYHDLGTRWQRHNDLMKRIDALK